VDTSSGVALLNKGLPCNRWGVPEGGEGGVLDLSLVRSPEYEFCAVEPGSYEFWDLDGLRDAGRHVFEYALVPYVEPLSAGDLTRMGYEYNLPAPLDLPFRVTGDVVVTAWKPAEDGSGWILRLQEASGTGTKARIEFDEPRAVVPTDLMERRTGGSAQCRAFETPLHKHGILTLWIR
jgi:alpha-mannosidase